MKQDDSTDLMEAEAAGNNCEGIVWLASYPKSGNTWTRILLSNLMHDGELAQEDAIQIDLSGSISSNRPRFDNLTGLPSSDLTDREIDILRPDLYREMAANAETTPFVKVHDAYILNDAGQPLFPADASLAAIYLIRHPMDVAVSYAHHQGHGDYTKVAKQMGQKNHRLAGGGKAQLRQKTLSWSGHYQSWVDQKAIPVLVIRYEDMLADTVGCLTKMANFLGLKQARDAPRLAAAVDNARFDRLQSLEEKAGFKERPEKAQKFFRSGRAGEGRERLSSELQERICREHGAVMAEMGYD